MTSVTTFNRKSFAQRRTKFYVDKIRLMRGE